MVLDRLNWTGKKINLMTTVFYYISEGRLR